MRRKIFIAFFVAIFLFSGFFAKKVFSAVDCSVSATIVSQANRDFCQNQLNALMQEQADLEAKLKDQSKQTGTLKGDVTVLTTQINALKTKVKARGVVIAQLKNSIKEKVSTIGTLSDKIDREHESLAQLLRNTNEFDNENILNLILSTASISDFYSDLESYTSIKQSVKTSVEEITGVKIETETQKKDLEIKQNAETDAKVELETTQNQVAKSETAKKQLLAISKDKEAAYQKLAAEKKVKADKIRAALFNLRDTAAIPFGTALDYARLAQKATGVPPAFILAIITQESNLGTDSGSCYLTNFETGTGISSKSGKIFRNVMKPMGLSGRKGDVDDFISITKSLGRDPAKTLVSCPIGGSGYGGAMGPAQFIPTTWIGIKDKVAEALGISSPDPWQPRDALMASAIFLSGLGASSGYSSQIRAACSYYGTGGKTCAYGRNVMSRVSKIQDNIDLLSN